MGKLIDADAFDKRIRLAVGSCEEELTEDFKDGISTILEMMKTAPTVDALSRQSMGGGCLVYRFGTALNVDHHIAMATMHFAPTAVRT